MKITPNSHKLMSFFHKYNCLPHINQTTSTNNLFKNLFNDIDDAVKFVSYTKNQMGNSFYNLKFQKIDTVSQITKPKTFNSNAFPIHVRDHIDEYSLTSLTYSFQFLKRDITIIFFIEDDKIDSLIDKYNNYVDHMLAWLYIVNEYTSKVFYDKLIIYIYHTSLTKNLPKSSIEILDENNVNTAFTRTGSTNSEIVVYRKEEWFKVFMHETFHNFALDFSDMNNDECRSKILSIFPVDSKVNLFEAYTEFWARIMNVLFCSYFNTKNKNNIDEFLSNTKYFIQLETAYSFFQMVKVLNFMNIEYTNLYEKSEISENIRKTLYKENTNVLSYYVITLILIYNYQSFLSWCKTNNTSLLQFKKTHANLNSFCRFIEKKYRSSKMLEIINCSNIFFKKLVIKKKQKSINKNTNKDTNKDLEFLTNNLRMTLCEMG